MNDLIQLQADLRSRHCALLADWKSLRALTQDISDLAESLKEHSCKIIQAENPFWAAVNTALAGAVEETHSLLIEAENLSKFPKVVRLAFFFCLTIGFESDVDATRCLFHEIKEATDGQKPQSRGHDKIIRLRTVAAVGLNKKPNFFRKMLSGVLEETRSQVAGESLSRQLTRIAA